MVARADLTLRFITIAKTLVVNRGIGRSNLSGRASSSRFIPAKEANSPKCVMKFEGSVRFKILRGKHRRKQIDSARAQYLARGIKA
jgi:hypothetical protein